MKKVKDKELEKPEAKLVRVQRLVMQVLDDNIIPSIGVEKMTLESDFVEDLGADSLDLVECIMALEEATELEIPDADCTNWRKIKDAVDYLLLHLPA